MIGAKVKEFFDTQGRRRSMNRPGVGGSIGGEILKQAAGIKPD